LLKLKIPENRVETMTLATSKPNFISPEIVWATLPDDFILPNDPVDNLAQPLLASVLRESLEIGGLITPEMLIATNFGICTQVNGKTVIKAPDWVYVPRVNEPSKDRRSYTPYTEGDLPLIVMEFISETEGGEYSFNPHYPYGKWYFYEQILQIPFYVIFHPETGLLESYRLINGHYQAQTANQQGFYWLEELNLWLGVWEGIKSNRHGYWLRWWDSSLNLLPLGAERVDKERQRAEQERQRAEQERQRAEQERQEKEELLKQLAELKQKLTEQS